MVYVNEKLTPGESKVKKYTRPGRKQATDQKQNNEDQVLGLFS